MSKYRDALPQLGNGLFLTDGGLETTLIFREGVDLPEFAAFVLLADAGGTDRLLRYYRLYMAIAAEAGAGFIAEAATWRASSRWASKLGYNREELAGLNRKAIAILSGLRDGYESAVAAPFVISGCIGPRDDAYSPSTLMEPGEALGYHSEQIATLADTQADLVSALTMTHTGEAIGVTRAAQHCGIPVVISFTVETDGQAAIGGIPRRGRPDSGRGNQRVSLLLHDQLCSPQPFRVRARDRPGLGAAARRYTSERLPQEPRRIGRSRRTRRRRSGRAGGRLQAPAVSMPAHHSAGRLLRYRSPPHHGHRSDRPARTVRTPAHQHLTHAPHPARRCPADWRWHPVPRAVGDGSGCGRALTAEPRANVNAGYRSADSPALADAMVPTSSKTSQPAASTAGKPSASTRR